MAVLMETLRQKEILYQFHLTEEQPEGRATQVKPSWADGGT